MQRENPVFQIIYFPVHCFTIGPANKAKPVKTGVTIFTITSLDLATSIDYGHT